MHRAEGILNRGNVDAFAMEESQSLSIFFATNNSVTNHLKKGLEEVRLILSLSLSLSLWLFVTTCTFLLVNVAKV